MNNFKLFYFLILFSIFFQSASAIEFKSYQKLSSPISIQLSLDSNTLFTNENQVDQNELNFSIQQNLNKNWPKVPPKFEIQTIQAFKMENYSGGTGTRGGGSGLIIKTSDTSFQVKLLEIFRSENLDRYNLFFPVDTELLKLEVGKSAEQSTQMIFETVLDRISHIAPNLGAKINLLYRKEMPFKNWIPLYQDLPIIEDEVKYPLEENDNKIQIAFRRTQHIAFNIRAYSAMSPLNRAALWMHEYIYALSSLEESVKTQRAVSLFFSSDFIKIASNEVRLTQLFFELDLLGISRKSVSGSLPPGTRLVAQKQIQNCGQLISIKGTPVSESFELLIKNEQGLQKTILRRERATVILSALVWGKTFLAQTYPIFKFYGQKIMPDKVCLNSMFSKITQIQVALAIDDDMAQATQKLAESEIEFFKAKSDAIEIIERQSFNPASFNLTDFNIVISKLQSSQTKFLEENKRFLEKSITPLEKMMYPKILGEYTISIDD
jgi:hypothetical protein